MLVICVSWNEHERGWGIRPDGVSLHTSVENKDKFIKNYWYWLPDTATEEYSYPDTETAMEVSEETYNDIVKAGGSLRFWQHEVCQIK